MPLPCGNDSMYCPLGSSAPLEAGPGHYTDGPPGYRSSRVVCPLGHYCPGNGSAVECPPGFFGNQLALTNATCSGRCGDGVLCAARTASAAGVPCPAGSYCVQGLAVPCPAGTYNVNTSASVASSCIGCPAGKYSLQSGASHIDACLTCSEFEGSGVGATTCWPGVRGTCDNVACALHLLAAKAI